MATVITTLAELQSACSSGGEYELGADITITSTITITNVTLSLDLKTYTIYANDTGSTFNIKGSNVTINGTTGGITKNTSSRGSLFYAHQGYSANGSSITINGGVFTSTNKDSGYCVDIESIENEMYYNYNNSFTMNGGTIKDFYNAVYVTTYTGPD